jgi:hypothetical protein
VLLNGEHCPNEDRFSDQFNRWSYAIVGKNLDEEIMKIIVSFSKNDELMFIVTAMYVRNRSE